MSLVFSELEKMKINVQIHFNVSCKYVISYLQNTAKRIYKIHWSVSTEYALGDLGRRYETPIQFPLRCIGNLGA